VSLTSILKKEKGRTNIKDWFRHHFPNPGLPDNLDVKFRAGITDANLDNIETSASFELLKNLDF